MDITTISAVAFLILALAMLYSSVGQAGASGYLAILALFGLAPAIMKPTALSLNILVACIATYRFYRAGCFSWSVFWPFALSSIPFALIGGSILLPDLIYKPVVGTILLFAAYSLFRSPKISSHPGKPLRLELALVAGAAIGLVSGLTGVGGVSSSVRCSC